MPDPRTAKNGKRRSPGDRGGAPPGEADGARPLVCTVAFCPICLAVTAAQGAAPDAMDHLLAAAREFFHAARAVMDARADHLAGEDGRGPRLEKIDIA